jgi:hypothetical protein
MEPYQYREIIMKHHTITEKLYQAGVDRADIVPKGGNLPEFDRLESMYQGGSIPAHVWMGTRYVEPYSSDYHTGGNAGALLRKIVQLQNAA